MSNERADTATREERHERCAAWLEGTSDEELIELLSDPRLVEVGYSPVRLPEGDGPVFAKLVPVTALELTPENRGATGNMFGLPVRYQSRMGSCGFGAWREVEVHRLANEWVRSGQCAGFPLMHHWRVLPLVRTGYDDRRELQPWGDCPQIHHRVAAVNEATSSVVLFLEYFPLTLSQWFRDQMRRASDPAAVVHGIEAELTQLIAFTHGQGVLHMDAHFDNLLTEGKRLYLTDYGLSVSEGFGLGPDEQEFFEQHESFDLCTAMNALVHAVVTYYDPTADWRQTVREVQAGAHRTIDVPPAVRSYLLDKAPLVLAMGEYAARFVADPTTPYPAAAFEELLARAAE